jgi:hypothetical protein
MTHVKVRDSFLYIEKFPGEDRRGDKVSGWVYGVASNLLQTRQTCLKLIHDSIYKQRPSNYTPYINKGHPRVQVWSLTALHFITFRHGMSVWSGITISQNSPLKRIKFTILPQSVIYAVLKHAFDYKLLQ